MRSLSFLLLVVALGGCEIDNLKDDEPPDTVDPDSDSDETDDSEETDSPVETDDTETDESDTLDETGDSEESGESDTEESGDTIPDDTGESGGGTGFNPGGTGFNPPDDTFTIDTGAWWDPETGGGDGTGEDESGDETGPDGTGDESGDDSAPECPPDEMLDCDGICVPEIRYGDGICNSGVPAGFPDFACADLNWDNGDCQAPDTGVDTDLPVSCVDPLDTLDCGGVCYPLAWVGDGNCDDGTVTALGSPDFNCPLFNDDNGDCVIVP